MSDLLKNEHVKQLLDYISDGIQIIDLTGILVYCNRKAAMLDDINISESIGKHITEIYPSLSQTDSTLLKVLETGEPIINLEQTYRTYKGKSISTINTTLPIIEGKKVIGAVEISKNITEYKELSERYIDLQQKVLDSEENTGGLKPSHLHDYYQFEDIITDNAAFNRVKTIAMKAARTEMPVLIYGETGTGKEMLAQSVHSNSKRRQKPFIAQNCAALPSSLLEGILFGTVKGGFTGAVDRPGLFELADRGTLFLDEINSMPLELQAKLLRALQEGKIRRIGDTRERAVDVRVLAAMNVEPNHAMEAGLLRRDLYYRLNTITLWIPKLSDRREDIPVLTKFFINQYNNKLYRNIQGISPEVKALFDAYDWPGNVRELEHVIEGAINFVEGSEITLQDLPPNLKAVKDNDLVPRLELGDDGLSQMLENVEKTMIESVFHTCDSNVSLTAKRLKMPRQTLQYKLKKYEIE